MRLSARLFAPLVLSALSCVPWHASAEENAAAVTVETGVLDGASYRIDVPAGWNHELIVFYHGYASGPLAFDQRERVSPMFDPMLAQGYALLQSGYSAGGWAVEEGYADTEKLRRAFVAKHGKPARSYVMGMSMGGTLAAITIEQNPDVYNGALSLCGALEPSDRLMQRDLALRAAFDYYFPDLLENLASKTPREPTALDEKNIAIALNSKPAAAQALLRWYGAAVANNLAPVIAFAGYEISELQRRAHGLPVGNADLIYVGSGDDAAINDGVKRYRAEPKAAMYLARWYTPSGKLTRPFLELHDTGDPLVPAYGVNEYALAASRTGHGDNFVQRYVNREGHCVFTPAEIGRAFDDLVEWVHSGKKPEPGKLR